MRINKFGSFIESNINTVGNLFAKDNVQKFRSNITGKICELKGSILPFITLTGVPTHSNFFENIYYGRNIPGEYLIKTSDILNSEAIKNRMLLFQIDSQEVVNSMKTGVSREAFLSSRILSNLWLQFEERRPLLIGIYLPESCFPDVELEEAKDRLISELGGVKYEARYSLVAAHAATGDASEIQNIEFYTSSHRSFKASDNNVFSFIKVLSDFFFNSLLSRFIEGHGNTPAIWATVSGILGLSTVILDNNNRRYERVVYIPSYKKNRRILSEDEGRQFRELRHPSIDNSFILQPFLRDISLLLQFYGVSFNMFRLLYCHHTVNQESLYLNAKSLETFESVDLGTNSVQAKDILFFKLYGLIGNQRVEYVLNQPSYRQLLGVIKRLVVRDKGYSVLKTISYKSLVSDFDDPSKISATNDVMHFIISEPTLWQLRILLRNNRSETRIRTAIDTALAADLDTETPIEDGGGSDDSYNDTVFYDDNDDNEEDEDYYDDDDDDDDQVDLDMQPAEFNNTKKKLVLEDFIRYKGLLFDTKKDQKRLREFQQKLDEQNILSGTDSVTNLIMESKPYTFGVEIETISGSFNDNREVAHLNMKAVHDGSLRDLDEHGNQIGQPKGKEYVTGVLFGDSGFEHLYQIFKTLQTKCSVDRRCSVHVHMGSLSWNNQDIAVGYLLGLLIQEDIFKMLPKSRRRNPYCNDLTPIDNKFLKGIDVKKLSKDEYNNLINSLYTQVFRIVSGGSSPSRRLHKNSVHPSGTNGGWDRERSHRYRWLNFTNIIFNQRGNPIYKTIEFRNHSGTLNFKKAKNWILIVAAYCDFVHNNKIEILERFRDGKPYTINEIVAKSFSSKTSKPLKKYINIRKSLFSDDPETQEQKDYQEKTESLKKIDLICV